MSEPSNKSNGGDVLILGSINTDYVITGPAIPKPGETVGGGEFVEARGGKGANQAVAAARAGAGVTMIGAIGSDAQGAAAVASLQDDGICAEHIRRRSDAASGVALILVDSEGENCISVAPGANAKIFAADVANVPESVFADAVLFLTNHEIPLDAVTAALTRAKEHGLTTILNPAPAEIELFESRAIELVDILTPNETEASLLTGLEVSSIESAQAAAQRLQVLGPNTVIITMGKSGCVFVTGDARPVHVPAPVVTAKDTTGAGDAFNGAFAAAIVEGRGMLESVQWATKAAALAVTKVGAQTSMPYRAEIDALSSS